MKEEEMEKKPKVTLISWTNNPLETVYSVWQASKNEESLMDPEEVKAKISHDEVETLFKAVIAQKIPVGEHIDFVFMLENVSVSWREQAVRHRIGTLVSPERLGVDIIPDLANSSWWSQSMRIQNMGEFATNESYRVPDSVIAAGKRIENIFRIHMAQTQTIYNVLVDAGVPMEDAREVIPLGAQHRISWKLNIGALQHIVGKRGCWILQLGIWGPVIEGMIEELATKINPIFRELVTPPCLEDDNFKGCVFKEECRRRLDGSDKLPPCPLHLNYHHFEGDMPKSIEHVPMVKEMRAMSMKYTKFWGRDPFTGRRIKVER